MANINIQWADAVGQSSSLKNCKKKMDAIGSKLNGIQLSGVFSKGNLNLYRRSIKGIINEVERESASMEQFCNGLEQVVQKYKDTEQRLSGLEADSTVDHGSENSQTHSNDWKDRFRALINTGIFGPITVMPSIIPMIQWNLLVKPNYSDLFWNTVGKFGIIGTSAKTIRDIAQGKWTSGKWVNQAAKFGVDMIGKTAKIAGERKWGTKWADYLLGISKGETKGIGEWFKDTYKFGKDKSFAKNVGVGAKWAGVALSAIEGGKRQYDRFKDGLVSGDEAVLGTVAHVATDFAIGAGIAALGATVGAPAIAVGAATVGVKWIADETIQFLTGDEDATFVGWVADGATSVYRNIKKGFGNAVSNAKNAIGSFWKDFTARPVGAW